MIRPSESRASGVDAELAHVLDDGALRMVTGLSRQNSVYRYMIDIWDEIADATLTGAGARQLAQTFARLIRRTVVLLDPRFGVHTIASPDVEPPAQLSWRADDPGVVRLLRALVSGQFGDVEDARHKMEALGFSVGTTYQVAIVRLAADGGHGLLQADQADQRLRHQRSIRSP